MNPVDSVTASDPLRWWNRLSQAPAGATQSGTALDGFYRRPKRCRTDAASREVLRSGFARTGREKEVVQPGAHGDPPGRTHRGRSSLPSMARAASSNRPAVSIEYGEEDGVVSYPPRPKLHRLGM